MKILGSKAGPRVVGQQCKADLIIYIYVYIYVYIYISDISLRRWQLSYDMNFAMTPRNFTKNQEFHDAQT